MLIYILYCTLSIFASAGAMQPNLDFLQMVQGDQYPNRGHGNQFSLILDYYAADMLRALHERPEMVGVVANGFQQWLNARVQELVQISDPRVQAHALDLLLARLKPSANNNFSNTLQQYNSDENSETIYNLGVIITGINRQLINLPSVNLGYYREFLDIANYYLGCSIHGSQALNKEMRTCAKNLISCNEIARKNLMNAYEANVQNEKKAYELASGLIPSGENSNVPVQDNLCEIVAPIPVSSSLAADLLNFEASESASEEKDNDCDNTVSSMTPDQDDQEVDASSVVCNTTIQCKRGFFPYKSIHHDNGQQQKNTQKKNTPKNSQRVVKPKNSSKETKPTPCNQPKKIVRDSVSSKVSEQSNAVVSKPEVKRESPLARFSRAVSLYEKADYVQAEALFEEYLLEGDSKSIPYLHALCYRAMMYMRKTHASYEELVPYMREIHAACSTRHSFAELKPFMNSDFNEKLEQWISVYDELYANASIDERKKLDEKLYYIARFQVEGGSSLICKAKAERLTLMFKAARTNEYAQYYIVMYPHVSLADRVAYAAYATLANQLDSEWKKRVLEHNEKFALQGHISSLMAQVASRTVDDEQKKIPVFSLEMDHFFVQLDKNFPEIKIGEHDGNLYTSKVLYAILDQYADKHWSARVLQAALIIAYISDDYSEVNAAEFTRLYEGALSVLEKEYKSHKVLKELLGTSYGIVGRFLQLKVVLNKDDIGLDEIIPAYQKAMQYFDKGVKLESSRSLLYRARLYLCDRDIPGARDAGKGIKILKDMIRNNQMVLEAAAALVVHFDAHNDKKNAQEYIDIAFRYAENNYNPMTWGMLTNMQKKIDAIDLRKANRHQVQDQEQPEALASNFSNSVQIRKAMSDFAFVIKIAKDDPEQALEFLKCIDNKQLAMLDEINGEKVDKAYKRLVITIKVAANKSLNSEQFAAFARKCDEVLFDFDLAHERLLVEFKINMNTLKGCAEKKIAELQCMQKEFDEICLVPDLERRQKRFDEFIKRNNLEAVIGDNNIHCRNFLVRNIIEQYFGDAIKKLTERCKRADAVLQGGLYE